VEIIMRSFGRLFAILSILIACACSTTHPRRASNLDELVKKSKKIAILRPQIDAQVKYIDTPEFFHSTENSRHWESMITTGMRRTLEKDGHKIFHYVEIIKMLPRGKRQSELLTSRLVKLTEPAIESDADYSKKTVPEKVTAKGLIPSQISKEIDFIIAVKGRSKIETIREFYARWTRNIGFNLLTFPITAASAFIPVPLPISVTISTSVFEASPEDMFVSLIVIDVKSGRIIYQNDYFHTSIPGNDEKLQKLGETLLEDFTRHDD
jgi:hypothetical protein